MVAKNRKYELLPSELVSPNGNPLYRMRALRDFGDVQAGDLGGYVEKEENLSPKGLAWVGEDAWVYGKAHVHGNSIVSGNTLIAGFVHITSNADYITIGPLMPRDEHITFIRIPDDIFVVCWDWSGVIQDFRSHVTRNGKKGEQVERYLAACRFAEENFKCCV